MAAYYDDESQIGKPAEYLITDFLDHISELHLKYDYIEIKKVLRLNELKNENTNDSIYANKSIRTNEYIRRCISVVKEIVAEKIFNNWIENILIEWNSSLNKTSPVEVEVLKIKCRFKNFHELNKTIHVKIDSEIWKIFTVKCRRMGLTNSEGFGFAIVYYILDCL